MLDVVAPDEHEFTLRIDDFGFENLDARVAQRARFRPGPPLAAAKDAEAEVQHGKQHQQKHNACNPRHDKRAAYQHHQRLPARAAALRSSRTIAGTVAAFKRSIV
jgi:hypothetical protein